MNFENVKSLIVDDKNVVHLRLGNVPLWKGLPAGYTLLDYIETTGTQWINTGFIPNQDSRIVCEFMFKGGNGIYGTRYSTATRNFALRMISSKWQPGYHTVLGLTDITYDNNKWHIAEQNRNLFYIDGVLAREFEYVSFTAPKSIALGGINANNAMYYGEGRYRGCQIYNNGILVRDFIPCQNAEGVVGMYDAVNAVFYKNAGSGEFEYGTIT